MAGQSSLVRVLYILKTADILSSPYKKPSGDSPPDIEPRFGVVTGMLYAAATVAGDSMMANLLYSQEPATV